MNFPKPFVIDDDQVAGGDELQPTPVPDLEPDSTHKPNSDHEPESNHEPKSDNKHDSNNEPNSTHEDAGPTCSSVNFEPGQLAQSSVISTVHFKDDIGYFLDGTKSADEITQVMQSMSDGQRYHLLKHHAQPSESYKFPTQYLGGANRSFKLRWIQECGWWLVYSCKVDGAFCICCALFAKERKNMSSMVNAPFRKWHHKSEVITAHLNKPSHVAAFQASENFIQSIDNPEATITSLVDKRRAENIAENRHILKCVAEAVLYCARQCIALREDHTKLDSLGNPGNFLSHSHPSYKAEATFGHAKVKECHIHCICHQKHKMR